MSDENSKHPVTLRNDRPNMQDAINEVFGNDALHKDGLIERVTTIEKKVEAVDTKFERWLERGKWLLIGLTANLAKEIPRVIEWFTGGSK